MDLPFIHDILQEINDDGSQESQHCVDEATTFEVHFKLNKENVLQLLEEMQEDEALGSLHGQIEKSQEQVPELCDKLQFLTSCVLKKGTKSTPSANENAWGRFYNQLVPNLVEISTITESTHLSSFLCLRLFKRMLTPAPDPVCESYIPPEETYSQEELDIISYIGGSVVSKVKKSVKRLQLTERTQFLEVLTYLIATDESGSENTDLIDCLDRGGLTRIKPQVVHMFITMEDIFVRMFKDTTTLSVKAFIRACGEHDDILCGYYETVYESEVGDLVKEQIVKKMLELYFTVRVHQKCRVYMDQVRCKNLAAKKQKSLRRGLKP